jgi:hypothetical protein
MGIGFRDSSTGRFVISVYELGDKATMWRFTNESTFSGVVTTEEKCDWHTDSAWLKFEDDGTTITTYVSHDGFRWFRAGFELRTAFVAAPDQLIWAINPEGKADKQYSMDAWVETT